MLQVAENIWSEVGRIVIGLGVVFPLRMTIIRLSDGSLCLHSPLQMRDELAGEISALGPVKHIVAPNALHHLHLEGTVERYPDAHVYAAPGVAQKQPAVRIDEVLGGTPAAFSGQLSALPLEGAARVEERVLFHHESATLIVTDLVFNVLKPEGLLTSVALKCTGAGGKLGHDWLFRALVQDKAAFSASVRRMLAWPFERVLMAHGDVVEHDAREVMRAALKRYL